MFNPAGVVRLGLPALLGFLGSIAEAQTVKLAVISEGTNTWPLYVAQAKKLFDREGVDVRLTLTGSSVRQLERLIRGEFDVGFQQSDHVVRAVENGSDLFVFMAQAHAPGLTLVTAPGVKSFADLKSRDIAVDGARTGYALLLRKLLADKGLKDGDYRFNEIGGSQERFDAVKSGAAAASFLNAPFDRNLLAAGFGSLGTTAEYFPTYPGSIAAARRAWARQNDRELIAFIRAFDAAYTWLQDPRNKDEAVAILPARLNIDPQVAGRAFDEIGKRRRPEVTPEGIGQVIDIVWAAEGLKGVPGEPAKYLDLSYRRRAAEMR